MNPRKLPRILILTAGYALLAELSFAVALILRFDGAVPEIGPQGVEPALLAGLGGEVGHAGGGVELREVRPVTAEEVGGERLGMPALERDEERLVVLVAVPVDQDDDPPELGQHLEQALGVPEREVWAIVGDGGKYVEALKDFAILAGSAIKRTRAIRPGPHVVLFATRLGRLEGLSDRRILDSRWFRLLGLDTSAVVDQMYTAAQSGLLQFRFQADVAEIELPSLEAPS